jgi:hypothetical protein
MKHSVLSKIGFLVPCFVSALLLCGGCKEFPQSSKIKDKPKKSIRSPKAKDENEILCQSQDGNKRACSKEEKWIITHLNKICERLWPQNVNSQTLVKNIFLDTLASPDNLRVKDLSKVRVALFAEEHPATDLIINNLALATLFFRENKKFILLLEEPDQILNNYLDCADAFVFQALGTPYMNTFGQRLNLLNLKKILVSISTHLNPNYKRLHRYDLKCSSWDISGFTFPEGAHLSSVLKRNKRMVEVLKTTLRTHPSATVLVFAGADHVPFAKAFYASVLLGAYTKPLYTSQRPEMTEFRKEFFSRFEGKNAREFQKMFFDHFSNFDKKFRNSPEIKNTFFDEKYPDETLEIDHITTSKVIFDYLKTLPQKEVVQISNKKIVLEGYGI